MVNENVSGNGFLVVGIHVCCWSPILQVHGQASRQGCGGHTDVRTVERRTVLPWALELVHGICPFELVGSWGAVLHD